MTPDLLAERKKADQQELVDIYRRYEAALAASNLLDYDDLLLRCGDLLSAHPEVVSNVQTVLVDEFQDTNTIQYNLMNLFASKNRRITIVGDPDQSIYGFRSAEIRNLQRMQKRYSTTKIVFLESNYRSSESILNSAQQVIEQDSSRPAKALQATHSSGTLPVLRKLPNPNSEAHWMVLEIKRCVAMAGGVLRMSDFAVLLRSASLSTRIETAFGRAGIPYKMVGGRKFFDRTEVKTLINYMRVVSHTGHTDALLGIINVPPRRIGDETIKQLTSGAEKAQIPLWTFMKDVIQGRRSTEKKLQKAAEVGLCALMRLIEGSRQKLQDCQDSSAPCVLLEYITESLSFQEYLMRAYPLDEDARWANVKELMGQASEAAASTEISNQENDLPEIGVEQQQVHAGEEALSRFLANVALATDAMTQDEGKEGEPSPEKVTISTIHAAKGLEWPVVFIPAVYNGSIPHSRAEEVDEERRLLYVAMTRAQALLYLSLPLRQPKIGEGEEVSTTLTPFLPSKLTKTHFRPNGPQLLERTIYSIADILGRPRPTPDDMYKALDSLPSTVDDQWTVDGEEKKDGDSAWNKSRGAGESFQEPYAKRRRPDSNQSTTTTFISAGAYNVGNSSNFMAPTTISSGFQSARDYIAVNPTPPEPQPKPREDPAPAAKAKTAGRKDGLSQSNISAFFGGPASTQKKEPITANRPQPRPAQADYPSSKPPAAAKTVPPTLSSHRVQMRPIQPPRPALESSGASYSWMADPAPLTAKTPRMLSQQTNDSQSTATDTASESQPANTSNTGVQSVMFHTTTMSKINQPSTAPVRRTLGIRRTMNGWSDRMKRENGGQ